MDASALAAWMPTAAAMPAVATAARKARPGRQGKAWARALERRAAMRVHLDIASPDNKNALRQQHVMRLYLGWVIVHDARGRRGSSARTRASR